MCQLNKSPSVKTSLRFGNEHPAVGWLAQFVVWLNCRHVFLSQKVFVAHLVANSVEVALSLQFKLSLKIRNVLFSRAQLHLCPLQSSGLGSYLV